MKAPAEPGNILVHRESGDEYSVTGRLYDICSKGTYVWHFELMEIGSPRPGRYWIQASDLGPEDSDSNFYVKAEAGHVPAQDPNLTGQPQEAISQGAFTSSAGSHHETE